MIASLRPVDELSLVHHRLACGTADVVVLTGYGVGIVRIVHPDPGDGPLGGGSPLRQAAATALLAGLALAGAEGSGSAVGWAASLRFSASQRSASVMDQPLRPA